MDCVGKDRDNDVLERILEKLESIEKRLGNIEKQLSYVQESSENMNEHISFVEDVYDTVKTPFYYVMNKIKPIGYIPTKDVKQLTMPKTQQDDDYEIPF